MKKIFTDIIGFLALFVFTAANGQQGLSVHVAATPQFSFLENKDNNNNQNYTYKATFNANFGLGAGYNFTSNIGVGLDVLYSLQGQRYKLNGVEFNQKNDYLKIPLYFIYNTDPSKKISFLGKLGPQVSFLSNSKLDDKDENTVVADTKDFYKKVTFGGMISAGGQYEFNNNLFLTAALRFDYDFTNADDDKTQVYPKGRATTHNMTVGLEVGLKYLLK